jgi:hypothetical protein
MKGHVQILDTIKNKLESEQFVNTITEGSLFDIDLNKQTIFPLVHLIVNNYTFDENLIKCNISILHMDNVDISKEEVSDVFLGNDNKQQVINTAMAVLNRIYQLLRHGDLYDSGYQIDGSANVEIFEERFENLIAGCTMTLDIAFNSDMTIC